MIAKHCEWMMQHYCDVWFSLFCSYYSCSIVHFQKSFLESVSLFNENVLWLDLFLFLKHIILLTIIWHIHFFSNLQVKVLISFTVLLFLFSRLFYSFFTVMSAFSVSAVNYHSVTTTAVKIHLSQTQLKNYQKTAQVLKHVWCLSFIIQLLHPSVHIMINVDHSLIIDLSVTRLTVLSQVSENRSGFWLIKPQVESASPTWKVNSNSKTWLKNWVLAYLG